MKCIRRLNYLAKALNSYQSITNSLGTNKKIENYSKDIEFIKMEIIELKCPITKSLKL
jgi:hypothetical protein